MKYDYNGVKQNLYDILTGTDYVWERGVTRDTLIIQKWWKKRVKGNYSGFNCAPPASSWSSHQSGKDYLWTVIKNAPHMRTSLRSEASRKYHCSHFEAFDHGTRVIKRALLLGVKRGSCKYLNHAVNEKNSCKLYGWYTKRKCRMPQTR